MHVKVWMHCRECATKRPAEVSAKKWARLSVGLTATGIRITCTRCEKKVADITPEQLDGLLGNLPKCDECEQCKVN